MVKERAHPEPDEEDVLDDGVATQFRSVGDWSGGSKRSRFQHLPVRSRSELLETHFTNNQSSIRLSSSS